eukprot:544464_1
MTINKFMMDVFMIYYDIFCHSVCSLPVPCFVKSSSIQACVINSPIDDSNSSNIFPISSNLTIMESDISWNLSSIFCKSDCTNSVKYCVVCSSASFAFKLATLLSISLSAIISLLIIEQKTVIRYLCKDEDCLVT